MSERVRLTVGGDVYHLGENQDASELRERILTAVREGGDFIDLSSRQDGSVLVYVSGGFPMKLETFELSPQADQTWDVGYRDLPATSSCDVLVRCRVDRGRPRLSTAGRELLRTRGCSASDRLRAAE